MTEQRTEDYVDVLEDLARSRGLAGAAELAQRVVELDPSCAPYSARDVLEASYGGVGRVVGAVLAARPLGEEEKDRLARAWRRTFLAKRS